MPLACGVNKLYRKLRALNFLLLQKRGMKNLHHLWQRFLWRTLSLHNTLQKWKLQHLATILVKHIPNFSSLGGFQIFKQMCVPWVLHKDLTVAVHIGIGRQAAI